MRPYPVPEEAKTANRRLSPRAVELLERFEQEPGLAAPKSLEDQDLPDWVRQFPYRLQPWPTFVSGDKLREMRTAAVEVARLVKSVPERIFGNDPARVAKYYGLEPAVALLMLSEPTGIEPAVCRGDFVDTERGFRCLEINLDSLLGGWQVRFLLESVLRQETISELAEAAPRARYVDPMTELFEHVTSRALADPKLGDARAVDVGFLISDTTPGKFMQGAFDRLAEEYRGFQQRHDPPFEGRLLLIRIGDITLERREIHVDGRRLHSVIDFQKAALDRNLFRSFKAGQVHQYNGPMSMLFRDKRNLALLSEHAEDRNLFGDAEREIVRAHVPWTREVRERITDPENRTVDLLSFAVDRRCTLVLKPTQGLRGEGIQFGRSVPPEAWKELLSRTIRDGGWMLQELEESVPYWYPGDGALSPHDVVWGLFVFGSRYAGSFVRMMPTSAVGNVVNAARGASEGLVLEIE